MVRILGHLRIACTCFHVTTSPSMTFWAISETPPYDSCYSAGPIPECSVNESRMQAIRDTDIKYIHFWSISDKISSDRFHPFFGKFLLCQKFRLGILEKVPPLSIYYRKKLPPPAYFIINSSFEPFIRENYLFEANFKSILGLCYASVCHIQSLLGLFRASQAFQGLFRPFLGLFNFFC